MPPSPVKLVDVALAASVDIATVSRALNRSRGWERLSPECVERVEAEAKRLGYHPNAAARGLRRRRSDTVGILTNPYVESAFNRELLVGHRELLWVGPDPAKHADGHLRAEDFRNALRKHGLSVRELVAVANGLDLMGSIAATREALLSVLSGRSRPQAGVCYHDPMALGVLAAARQLGLRVPEDLSVTGFDDSYGEVADPPLTTVSHSPMEIADAAVEMLLDIVKQKGDAEFTAAPVVVRPQLIVRESTGSLNI